MGKNSRANVRRAVYTGARARVARVVDVPMPRRFWREVEDENDDDDADGGWVRRCARFVSAPWRRWRRWRRAPRAVVDVRCAALNPVDAKRLVGDKLPARCETAAIAATRGRPVGFDFSGVVVRADANDRGIAPGARVFGIAPPFGGALADVVECPLDSLALAPRRARPSFRRDAAIGLCGVTILQALDEVRDSRGAIPSPVLVIGASGGLGHLACALVRAEGATAFGVCSSANLAFIRRELGVDAAPYDDPKISLEQHLERSGLDFKLILDTVTSNARVDAAPRYPERLRARVGDACRYVKFGGTSTQWFVALIHRLGVPISSRWRDFHPLAPPCWIHIPGCFRRLDRLARLVVAGDARPIIARACPFTQAGLDDAFDLVRSRRAIGKVIIDVQPDANDSYPSTR